MKPEKVEAPAKRGKKIDAIAKAMSAFQPARDVLTRIRVVPTNLIQVDYALRVGGWPVERIAGIHGPAAEGKSLLTLILVQSFLEREHFAYYNDAEFTTAIDWVSRIMGPIAASNFFKAARQPIYEDAVEEVRNFLEIVTTLRAAKQVPEETTALVVIDSLRKLTPRGLFDKIAADKGGFDGAEGRAGQIRAKYNAAWMDELPPLLARTLGTIIFVLREMEDTQASTFDKSVGNDWKVAGGQSVKFEPSILARVTRAAYVKDGNGEEARVVGERHRVTIRKSKIAGREGKFSIAYFHSSNGKLIPEGHDRARDVIDLGLQLGVLEKSGNWICDEKERIANGLNNAVVALTKDASWLLRVDAKVRAAFAAHEPVEYDEETGEIE